MSTPVKISATEHGVIRVFAWDGDDVPGLDEVKAALGARELHDSHVDIIDLNDLDEYGLSGYLTEGLGVAKDEVAPLAPRFGILKGRVVVISSPAFGGVAQSLTVRAPLRPLATLNEMREDIRFEELPAGATRAEADKPRASNAAMSGRIAALALLIMFALVALMVWIAA